MTETPRRPILQAVPAALAGAALPGVAGAEGRPVADGGRGRQAVTSDGTDVRYVTREATTPVGSGDADEVRVTAREGRAMEVQAVTASAPAVDAATAGTHALEVGAAAGDATVLRGEASAGEPLSFDGVEWRAADEGSTPADGTAAALAVRGLLVDDDVGLAVRYRNDTNAVQSDARTVHVWGVERPAGPE